MSVRGTHLNIEKAAASRFPRAGDPSAIINEHFVTGEPVGSKILAENLPMPRV